MEYDKPVQVMMACSGFFGLIGHSVEVLISQKELCYGLFK